MSSLSMTPAKQLPVPDSQPNIESGWPSAPDFSNDSNFWDLESFFVPKSSFEDLGPEIQSAGGMQECLQAWSSVFDSDDTVSITTLGSTPAKPLDISAPKDQENHTNAGVESSIATVPTLEECIHSPATLSTTKTQSKPTLQQTVIDLTRADSDHVYATPPDTPKSGLLSSLSIDSDSPISSEKNSRPASNGTSNTKKRKCSTGFDNSSKRRQPPRKTTVKQHLANEIHHSSQWLAGMEKSIDDCEADLVSIEEKKARFLAEIEEKRKEVTRRKKEFIELKNSMVAWGAREREVSEEWKSR
ncbi:hypothetical protein HYALB_00002202 [Hymenoscyphus albidus]|uniref:Uncharacterized protein n=1 Tax=Hymenoscyphus albidus TaxID=595503 RepID=A0A9N9Q4U4_9HELO|nr:hypothetical protein HYALB_00002202 [Hymenoscyphus albidus]